MTDTIHNVPRELLADLLGNDRDKRIMAERHLLAMLANAPSPAGVDGLEVVGLSERIRPGAEAAPWVCDEVKKLEAIIDGLRSVIDKAWNRGHQLEQGAYIPGALDAWKRPVLQNLPYDFSGNPGTPATQYCNGWNDAGGYWKAHADDLAIERNQHAKRIGELEGLLTAERNKVPLYEAVERACGDLPEGWKVELHMENGAAWIELYDAEGIEVENFPTNNERLDYTINDATDSALSAGKDSAS